MNNYFELLISINPALEDYVADIFFTHFDCEGVLLEEQTYKNLEMVSTTKGVLKVFLKSLPENLYEIISTERALMKERGFSDEELGSWELSVNEKENQDWSQKWKEQWRETRVTDNIIVVPSWIKYQSKQNEIVINLDPGCAFGTGTHQTTQLCMKAMEKFLTKGDEFADIGTGSGILAILAQKMGAKNSYGCDIDETVISVAQENASKNNVICVFEENSADKLNKQFDFVCANILHNVLVDIMPDLKKILKQNSKLVLSGILDEKAPDVVNAINNNNLKIIDTLYQEPWVAYVVAPYTL